MRLHGGRYRGQHSFSKACAIGTFFAALFFIALVMCGRVRAHDAPTGWSYPFSCCSTTDCRRVPADWIREQPDGFTIVMTGEIVGHQDARIKQSPDGEYHWCSVAGSNDSRTICLFVPPRGL